MKVKRMAQFRYFGENNLNNFPEQLLDKLIIHKNNSGEWEYNPEAMIFYKYGKIKRLNITTIPGIYIHIVLNDQAGTIIQYVTSATGILDFEYDDLDFIGLRGIYIPDTSVQTLQSNPDNFFILTIVYEQNIKVTKEEDE